MCRQSATVCPAKSPSRQQRDLPDVAARLSAGPILTTGVDAATPLSRSCSLKRLKTLFDAFPAEENRLVEQARQKQAQMNNTSHQAGCLGFGFRGRKGIGRRLGWLGVVTGQQPSAASMETHGVRQEQTRR
jgi:hypothetical protein